MWEPMKWPGEPITDPTGTMEPFYEGSFLRMILNRMSRMLHQVRTSGLRKTNDTYTCDCKVAKMFPVERVQQNSLKGGHGTGKTGNLVLTFSRQGKHREFGSDTGKNLLTQGKYLDCDY